MLKDAIVRFASKKISVVGDVMLDRYLWGEVSRISPEAPVPVVLLKQDTNVPGGAANTCKNVTGLGGGCEIIGVVGSDDAAQALRASLGNVSGSLLVTDATRPTIQKTRVMGNRQQLARLDKEVRTPIGVETEKQLIASIKQATGDTFVVSDYAKGTLTSAAIAAVHAHCRDKKIPLICDGKPQNKDWFKGCTLITPNKKEAYAMAGAHEKESIESIGQRLTHELGSNVLITLSEHGMILFETSGKTTHIPTKAQEVFDVSGAGDTAVAAIALALASGASLIDACRIGNYAAGIVVGKLGTAICSQKELLGAVGADGQ